MSRRTCPDCGERLGDPVNITPRFIEEIPEPDPFETTRYTDVVHVNETGFMINSHQAWLWTFRTAEATLFALRATRGRPVSAEILAEDFDGMIVCDGWTAYPAFSSDLQRCWAHLLREADDVAAEHGEAALIADRLPGCTMG